MELTRADGSPLRVLVVDDEVNIAELIWMALRYEGWQVTMAHTGTRAVAAATPAGTTVTVGARDGGFSVHDDGPGFRPGLAEHAFERFARGDASRTRGTDSGAGLGLALVQAIVQAHGGSVRLASAPGDTTLDVRLPR